MIPFKLGWIPQPKDDRDLKMSISRHVVKNLPPVVDLSQHFPEPFDQGQLSSCTGNAVSAAILYDEVIEKGLTPQTAPVPSRLFLYYEGRAIEGAQNEDQGAIIRDVVKSANTMGFPSEELWPYIDNEVNIAPSKIAIDAAAQHTIKVYRALNQTKDDLCGCLASGYPFVFGFQVYSNIMNVGSDGLLPPPSQGDTLEGGHAICAVGYDMNKRHFKIRNSWGIGFGDKGYFYMPFDYVLNHNLSNDFWTITRY